MSEKILKEAMTAYADCNLRDEEEGYKLRELDWEASELVSRDEAISIMHKALSNHDSYNAFDPECLSYLPEHAQVRLGRGNSVEIYVKREPSVTLHRSHQDKMLADEFDYYDNLGMYRFWWD